MSEEAKKPIKEMTAEERRQYQRAATQRSRERKREILRPRTLVEKLERALEDTESSGQVQLLLTQIYNDRKKQQVEFLITQIENPEPGDDHSDIEEAIDTFLEAYEHRGPFSRSGSHPLGFPWSFDLMKARLNQTKLGRLLLTRYGNTRELWIATRQGKQDAA